MGDDGSRGAARRATPDEDVENDEDKEFRYAEPRRPRRVDLRRYESFASELVQFATPHAIPAAHAELINKIVVLDHRSLHAFGLKSQARAEVKALLQNAAITAGYWLEGTPRSTDTALRDPGPAFGLYRQAEEIFRRHLENGNRLRYLVGVFGGIVFLIAVAFGAKLLPNKLEAVVPLTVVPLLIFFAGLGSIVSVLLRLSKLDVVKEISRPVLLVSGAGRPLVASAIALVVYIAIANNLVSLGFGEPGTALGKYLVVAFLCGFSERYAKDVLERFEKEEAAPSARSQSDSYGSSTGGSSGASGASNG